MNGFTLPSQTEPQVASPFDLENDFPIENQQQYVMVDYTLDSFCENALYAYYPNLIAWYAQLGVQESLQDMASAFEKFTSCENYCKGKEKIINAIDLNNRLSVREI